VQCLLDDFGADVILADEAGCTPLYTAAQNGLLQLEVSLFLVKDRGADANEASQKGLTPLLLALEHGHLRVADVNKATHDGRTPLIVASYYKHPTIVHLLTKRGADSQTKMHC
jgi:ankyrin repeat protein